MKSLLAIKCSRITAGALAATACLAALTVGANSIYELGTIIPDTPANPINEQSYLGILVSGYNAGKTGTLLDSFTGDSAHTYTMAPGSYLPSPNLPGVLNNFGQVAPVGKGPKTGLQINLGTGGYDYLTVKWGQDGEAYYIGNLTGMITVNNDVNLNGESHYTLYSGYHPPHHDPPPAPDGGVTLGMFGISLSGLWAFARNRKRAA